MTCVPTGERWVGSTNELGTVKNRIWFRSTSATPPWRELQAAWNKHGADAVTYEEIDRLDEDLEPFAKQTELKDRLAAWREKLGARLI